MSRRLWLKVGASLLLLAGAGALYQIVAPRLQPLPVYMALPEAKLIDENGQPFALNQTRGKVVVLSFIYTHCPDICPLTTAKMEQIQEGVQTAGLSNQVQLVTFTVDPQHDSPDVLKRFTSAYNFDPSNWVFLTGTADQINILIKGLDLYVQRDSHVNDTAIPETALPQPVADTSYLVNHTDRMLLIGRQGNVRALLPGSRTNVDDGMQLIRRLVKEQRRGES